MRLLLLAVAIAMAAFVGYVFVGLPLGIFTSVIGLTGRWSIKVFPFVGAVMAVAVFVYSDVVKEKA